MSSLSNPRTVDQTDPERVAEAGRDMQDRHAAIIPKRLLVEGNTAPGAPTCLVPQQVTLGDRCGQHARFCTGPYLKPFE